MNTCIGLLGRGRWSANIARTLASFQDVSVVPIGSHDSVSARLDGVIIANKSRDHAAAALPYLEAGIATFIEKPMTTTVVDAERIRRVALTTGASVLVGHIHLYNPAFEQLLAALPELGPIKYIVSEGANNQPRHGCSVLWDWLPHDLSMLDAIFDRPPDSVAAWKLCQEPVHHAAVIRFTYGDQICVSNVSWCSNIPRRSMTIVAQEKTLEFDDKIDEKVVVHSGSGVRSHWRHINEAPLAREMAAFLQIVRTGQATQTSLDLAVSIARCIDAAEQSIRLDGKSVLVLPPGL